MIQNFNIREYTAEFIGTFIMVFCGTGAVIVNDMTGQPGHPGIAVTFGLAVMAVIYAVGEISGAHINPAVTFGFFIAKKISFIKTFFYSVFQILGAVFASLILSFLFPSSSTLGSTLPSGNLLQSFILEIVLTFILMFVIIQVATGSKETGTLAGIAIGGTVALEAMFAGPISGASMNPARSIGPAVVSGELQFLWIYLTAPFLGSVLAAAVFHLFQKYK